MALFPLETIILHRVGTEYLEFSMVLQNIFQNNSGALQPTSDDTKNSTDKKKTQHNKKKKQQSKLSQDKK